jgi:hypothetical protein
VADYHGPCVTGNVLGVVFASVVNHEDKINVRDGFGCTDCLGNASSFVFRGDDNGNTLALKVAFISLGRLGFGAAGTRRSGLRVAWFSRLHT